MTRFLLLSVPWSLRQKMIQVEVSHIARRVRRAFGDDISLRYPVLKLKLKL